MVSNPKAKRAGKLKDPPPTATTPTSTLETEEDTPNDSEEGTESRPKFEVKQKVFARDASSSLWYEAIVRRSLYGVHHNKQVHIGLVSDETEIEELLAQTEAPSWHYFVHYNKWNTNWDRWVSEEDIMEENDESKRIANRYLLEHKKLQKELKKGKGKSSGDGTAFLNAWSKRMEKVAEDLKREKEESDSKKPDAGKTKKEAKIKAEEQPPSTESEEAAVAKPKPKKKSAADRWDKAAIAREYKLRLRGLQGKRSSQEQNKMTLPFSLKKVMVEAWEIITQCQMVSNLPAKVTVRQGLDKYLQSKLELIVPSTTVPAASAAAAASPEKAASASEDSEPSEEETLQKRRQEWIDMVEGIAMFFDDALPFRLLYPQELSQYKVVESTFVTTDVIQASDGDAPTKEGDSASEAGSKTEAESSEAKAPEEGKSDKEASEPTADDKDKMQVDTEVSPSEEKDGSEGAAKSASESKDESSNKKDKPAATTTTTRKMLPSEVYGCEHLLRLCLKIPELLAEQMPTPRNDDDDGLDDLAAYEHECKQILAKVNDLIRFLHKHQSTVFADSYRKLNVDELREEQKNVRSLGRNVKRKRGSTTVADAPAAGTEGDSSRARGTTAPDAQANKQQKLVKTK